MTLGDLESALRPQFLWEPGGDHWQNPRHYNLIKKRKLYLTEKVVVREKRYVMGTIRMGLTVFIGLAHLHKFSNEEVIWYLNMEEYRHEQHLSCFLIFIEHGIKNDMRALVPSKRRYADVLYLKARLVQNCLKVKYNAPAVKFGKAT